MKMDCSLKKLAIFFKFFLSFLERQNRCDSAPLKMHHIVHIWPGFVPPFTTAGVISLDQGSHLPACS